MRHNVAISTLVACLIGLSAADEAGDIILRRDGLGPGLGTGTSPSQVVTFDALQQPAIISKALVQTTFTFTANDVVVDAVRLKEFNKTKSPDGHDDTVLQTATGLQPTTPTAGGTNRAELSRLDTDELRLQFGNSTVVVEWGDGSHPLPYLYKPVYLECEWKNSSVSGESTSQIFVVHDGNTGEATDVLNDTDRANDTTAGVPPPARDEITSSISSSPPATTSTTTITTTATGSSTAQTTQPPATLGSAALSQAQTGLSKGGVIGVAVGVSVAGLLVAGVLAWLFCVRRRRRRSRSRSRSAATTHHMMPSYGSDVGVHTMIPDKEMPAAHGGSSSSPQSVYDGRPSADVYAPYSDRRSAASPIPAPVPVSGPGPGPVSVVASAPFDRQQQHQHQHQHQHQRSATGGSVGAVAAAATSETDLNSWSGNGTGTGNGNGSGNGRNAPTPTSLIASRYAHLVEEGMTEDEIRRLEEEERQLDAAIEHAGRRGGPS
ncbi:hypothetical protein F5Y09DRAFT_137068 [Xylaria sp. FL1042]|nr:hypothetical protein F5Y09DRAFT_137068 [Xylaria sp. FL1042]